MAEIELVRFNLDNHFVAYCLRDGTIVQVSAAACEAFSVSDALHLVGQKVQIFLRREDVHTFMAYRQPCLLRANQSNSFLWMELERVPVTLSLLRAIKTVAMGQIFSTAADHLVLIDEEVDDDDEDFYDSERPCAEIYFNRLLLSKGSAPYKSELDGLCDSLSGFHVQQAAMQRTI